MSLRAYHIEATACRRRASGFTLIELMIAATLGIFVSIGLVTLFGALSKTNRVQQSMAEMQENGRFAITKLNYDLRVASRQMMSMAGYSSSTAGSNGSVNFSLAPNVYVNGGIPFPDGTVNAPTGWPATNTSWPLSPRYFLQGYSCPDASCTPNSVPAYLPAISTNTDQSRVQGADVLTMRYLNAQGWSSTGGEVTPNCAGGQFLVDLKLTPISSGSYPSVASNFVTNDLAMLASSSGDTSIFQVTVTGTTLTPTNLLHPTDKVACPTTGSGELRLYNFSRNFITVTYWLRLDADPAKSGRFIPALVRTQINNKGNVSTTELVQGIEQMNFLFGLQKANGTVMYLKASDVLGNSSATACTSPPAQYVQNIFGTYEPACLWRSIKSIETHILADSVNNSDLAPDEMAYQYNGSGTPAAPAATLPSGLPSGTMMRREFVSLTSLRNFNP